MSIASFNHHFRAITALCTPNRMTLQGSSEGGVLAYFARC